MEKLYSISLCCCCSLGKFFETTQNTETYLPLAHIDIIVLPPKRWVCNIFPYRIRALSPCPLSLSPLSSTCTKIVSTVFYDFTFEVFFPAIPEWIICLDTQKKRKERERESTRESQFSSLKLKPRVEGVEAKSFISSAAFCHAACLLLLRCVSCLCNIMDGKWRYVHFIFPAPFCRISWLFQWLRHQS